MLALVRGTIVMRHSGVLRVFCYPDAHTINYFTTSTQLLDLKVFPPLLNEDVIFADSLLSKYCCTYLHL